MEKLFSESRIYSKLDTEKSTCTLHNSCKKKAFLAGLVLGTTIHFSKKPPIDGNHYYDCKKRSGVTNYSVINTKFHSPLFVMSTRNSPPI
ncbi:hypothetical protein VP01_894g6 [Puccinia sorghi]|uniref:Uncharacterized protein n=1 Tax=Puccinia sorghi TaxID=27349 RepID=A0A0L6U7Y2_9BASI|nr:hypothetical protein VP01_894g6 [Puccinia sorghi]